MGILLGLIALGVVVTVHELGHFLAAKLCGVEVESFSLGWGPVLLRKTWRGTEYRLSAFPLGGYCGMKGENAWRTAVEENLDEIPEEKGGFYSAGPLRRILIGFAGPFANLVLAFLLLSAAGTQDYSFYTWENRIIPVPHADDGTLYPAQVAGLQSGDRILSLDGTEMHNFYDIQQYVGTRAQESIGVVYERDGTVRRCAIVPRLERQTGLGKIGVTPYIPLTVGSVKQGSSAQTAGIRPGDRILAVDGVPASNSADFDAALADRPEQITLTVLHETVTVDRTVTVVYRENGTAETGIGWKPVSVTVPGVPFPACLVKGLSSTAEMVSLSLKSLSLLFRGVDLTEAVAGPVRVTVMLGEATAAGAAGFLELAAIICVSLFLMNLLPVPVLDGGVILLALIELASGRRLRPAVLARIQTAGAVLILLLFIFALFGDIRYFFR